MKAKKYLVLAIVIGVLCIPVPGEVELLQSHELDLGLIDQPYPALAGIVKLYVVIVPPDAEPTKNGLLWKKLQAKVEQKLIEADVKVGRTTRRSNAVRPLNIPELKVGIEMLKLADSQQYVFRIQTSLARMVTFQAQRNVHLSADVWRAEPVMQTVSIKSIRVTVTNVVMEQVETFIQACLGANPKGTRATDANRTSTLVRQKRAKPAAKSAAAKYKYVASKNSKIFHKADCSSAKGILPKNLISYSSRGEAVKAGVPVDELDSLEVMQREAYFCAARSKNVIDIVLMPQGLHARPDKLRSEVQKALERTTDSAGQSYDASLLGYGLCCNGIVGLSTKIPVVIPRGHDCITLLLGSKDKYQQYFDSHRGVYWYSPGWIEAGKQPGKQRYERTLKEYEKKYGAENARHLMETEENWITKYNWATYIDWGLGNCDGYKEYTRQCAEFLGWNYDQLKGDPALMQRLVNGQWNDKDFLVVRPGQKITEDLTNDGIIKAD